MENTHKYSKAGADILEKAKSDLMEDMRARGIGAVIWDLSTVGFQYIPEIVHVSADKQKTRVARVTGLYSYNGTLYIIEEDRADVSVDSFYDRDTEVKPSVVTLSEDKAEKELGDPEAVKGYTTQGSVDEWLTIADCYFQALSEYNPPM